MSKISFFLPFDKAQKGAHKAEVPPVEMMDFLHDIKYGKWREQVEAIRKTEDAAQKALLKKNVSSVTMSGVFTHRKADALLEHSGFICIDIDGYEDKTGLKNDPYTYGLFTSIGGHGLAVVVKVKKEKHKESFRWIQSYYYKTYGIVVDPAPSSVASLRFVSYDPELYTNEKSKTALTLEEKKPPRQKIPVILSNDDLSQVLDEIQSKNINIAESYEDYRNIAFAIADGFGETGRTYFHIIASVSSKYKHNDADRQYNISLKSKRAGITVGTFYWMAKQAGVTIPDNNRRAIHVASIAKRNDRTKEAVVQQLVELENVEKTVAEEVVNAVYDKTDIAEEAFNGVGIKELMEAIVEFLRQNYQIRKNCITQKLEVNKKEMTQEVFNTVLIKTKAFFNSKEITRELIEQLLFSEYTEVYNPITEYIEKNKHRTSTGNISRLHYSLESPTPLKEVFIRKWMLSIIAAYEGHPVRSVLALTGGQNTGKTEFFRRLLPTELQKYYAESKLDAGKDDELLMCQKLIVMDDEMGGKSKQDEKRFKELTSKHTFSIRAPYARFNEDFKRLAILCGTSNDPEVMSDPTGNTRMLPIEVIEIYHDNYNNIDKDDLFMEAYRCYHDGEEWKLNREELATLKQISEDFESTPYERELLNEFFGVPQENERPDYMTATMIKELIETQSNQKIFNMTRFGIELRKKFGKKTFSKGVGKYKVFILPYK